MSPRSPENAYISQIDAEKRRNDHDEFTSEGVVLDFFTNNLEGFEARTSTIKEDSGKTEIGEGQQVDIVLSRNKSFQAGVQVTESRDKKMHLKKMQALRDKPFVRLPEMKQQDVAIPKILIFLDADEVTAYRQDSNFANHPKLAEQILVGMENSLRFDLTQTKNPKEQAKVKELLDLVLKQKAQIKKGETIH